LTISIKAKAENPVRQKKQVLIMLLYLELRRKNRKV
jgi:hypothetical protein